MYGSIQHRASAKTSISDRYRVGCTEIRHTMRRRLLRCRRTAATIPGTPAIVSKNRMRLWCISIMDDTSIWTSTLPEATAVRSRHSLASVVPREMDSHLAVSPSPCNRRRCQTISCSKGQRKHMEKRIGIKPRSLDKHPRNFVRKGCRLAVHNLGRTALANGIDPI